MSKSWRAVVMVPQYLPIVAKNQKEASKVARDIVSHIDVVEGYAPKLLEIDLAPEKDEGPPPPMAA